MTIGGFGGAAFDRRFSISRWPDANETAYIRESRTAPGGMTLGALFAASKLGATCSYYGALGDDEEGLLLRQAMDDAGIHHQLSPAISGKRTPFSQIMCDPDGKRTIFHCRGVRDCDFLTELNGPCPEEPEILLLDGSWMKNSLSRAREAAEKKIPIVLDISPNNTHPLRDELIDIADFPVLNEDIASKISGTGNAEEQVRFLQKRFGRKMIVTAGKKGAFAMAEDGILLHAPAFPVDLVDSNGAGDCFHRAFAVALCRKMPLKEALVYASAAAAAKCRGHGWDGLPDHKGLRTFIENQKF